MRIQSTQNNLFHLQPDEPSLRITTPRLILRTLQDEDIGDIMQYASNVAVNRFMQWPSQPCSLRLGIEYNNHIIGECGLIFQVDHIELYYVLARAYWGHGFATEAATFFINYVCTTCDIDQIEAWIVQPNKRSQRVAERLHMHHTSTLEKQWQYNGRLYDIFIYTLNG